MYRMESSSFDKIKTIIKNKNSIIMYLTFKNVVSIRTSFIYLFTVKKVHSQKQCVNITAVCI